MIVQLQRDHSLAGRALCEDDSDRCLIVRGGSVSRVMHLEDEIGTGGNELRHSVRPLIGRTSGGIDQQQIAGGFMSLALLDWIAEG